MILYRTSGPWGAGVGANLTAPQVDGNFYDLSQRVQFMELHPAEPVQITQFRTVGDKFYIHMSDGTVNGPLTMPVAQWRFRGAWAPSTQYFVNDVFTGPDGAAYIVVFDHVSSSTNFNFAANDGAGHNYYAVLLESPAAILPSGGLPGQVLTRAHPADYSVQWTFQYGMPVGGAPGQWLQKTTSVDGAAVWADIALDALGDVSTASAVDGDYLSWDAGSERWVNRPAPSALGVLTDTVWTPVVGDEGSFMVLTNGTVDTSIIIPSEGAQPFANGTELHVHQDGTGLVSIVGDVGVTILKHANFSNRLLGQYATATVKKTGPDEWRLFGLLAPA